MVSDVDKYIVNLLAALVYLRIFTFDFIEDSPIMNGHPFIMEVSDHVPHLEYFPIPPLDHFYKRVGGELVVCDETETEFPEF
jgi:hypothetical protein